LEHFALGFFQIALTKIDVIHGMRADLESGRDPIVNVGLTAILESERIFCDVVRKRAVGIRIS
jgi:hypothetical protein